MPRHEIHQLILEGYREHGITLPYPPFRAHRDAVAADQQRPRAVAPTPAPKPRDAGACALRERPANAGPLLFLPPETSGDPDREGQHVAQARRPRQHHQRSDAQRHAGTPGMPCCNAAGLRSIRCCCGCPRAYGCPAALFTFTAVGQLAETVRQLDALEVHLKTPPRGGPRC